MDKATLHRLNRYLGEELGNRPDGHPIFCWKNSDDLFWPAFATGRNISQPIDVPIIGAIEVLGPVALGTTERVDILVPEYHSDRQMRARDTWVVTKWLDPEALIWGWIGRHGGENKPSYHPPHERLVEMWNEKFPGADFPTNGWRIPTDAKLPSSENGQREPNWFDTRRFVALVKEQTRLGFEERLADMLAAEDRQNAAVDKRIADEIRGDLPAFLNPIETIGKRGGWISMPWSKKDRAN